MRSSWNITKYYVYAKPFVVDAEAGICTAEVVFSNASASDTEMTLLQLLY
jgi:hypothetical protein